MKAQKRQGCDTVSILIGTLTTQECLVPGEPKLREVAVNIQQILSGKTRDVELGPDDILVVPTSSRKIFTTTFIPNTVSAAVGAAIYHC
jgi:hypothetical protein